MYLKKIVEWNMGHRIPNHETDQHLHGHRFKLELEIIGNVNEATGLIIDLKELKKILDCEVVDILDHCFVYWKDDMVMHDFFEKNPKLRHMELEKLPTTENILSWIHNKLIVKLGGMDVRIARLVLWESASSCASVSFEGRQNEIR